jgi:perosamine synthetase
LTRTGNNLFMIPIAKPYFKVEEARAAYDAVLSGWVTQGPKVHEFEEAFAKYVGSKYAVAVSSCTTALHLALIVAGIKSEDEVICPSLSFIATANSIRYTGAKPVFAEVDDLTYNMDAKHTESLITPKTKAILIVHQMGFPADIDAFKQLCKKYNLQLIEDAACAVGSSYKGKKIGSHSDLVCFSFHPRKVITTGDGGMITTSNEEYYNRLKRLRQHGMSVSDRVRHSSTKVIFEEYTELGYNYRMTDIQAAIGIAQLNKLDWIVSERRKIAEKYNNAFININCLHIPFEKNENISNYQSYSIYLKKEVQITRNELMQKMLDEGISTRRGIMTIHRELAYKHCCENLILPVTERVSDRSILLPLFVQMKEQEINKIISCLTNHLL